MFGQAPGSSARRAFRFAAVLVLVPALTRAQAVKGEPRPGAAPPIAAYFGLVPGVSTVDEVRGKLGEPAHEAAWYAWKMLYPSATAPGAFDSIHLQSSDRDAGVVGNIEAATVPSGFETREKIIEFAGEPEFHLTYPEGQELLDYSERGARFVVDREGRTIGAAYFPHGFRRVHAGARRRIDLSGLVQGPRESAPGADMNVEVGAATVDVTPAPEVFARKFEVKAPLLARCMVVCRDELRVAVVGADLFGLLWSEIAPIETRLREKGMSDLIFASSHDHAAPDTIGIYGYYPRAYVEAIQDAVVDACVRAYGARRPAKELLVSSEDLSLRGARVEGLFRNARHPGIVDPQMAVAQFRDASGDPIVTLVHFACHPEGLAAGAAEISPDFPGVLCAELESSIGAPALFLNGALGGMVSGDSRERTHEESRATGLRLASEARRILAAATPSRGDAFSLKRLRIEVPVTNARFLAFQQLAPERRTYDQGRVASEMAHLRIGDLEMLTVPGELLPELSFELLERMTGYPRLIVGLANDELGYIIPAYDFRAGYYEESMSVGPAIGPVVLETGLRLLGR